MKNRIIFLLSVVFTCTTLYGQGSFFSDEDVSNIKMSAHTSWGKVIIDSLKAQVHERRKHLLTLPVEEGGHLHDFFCPVHNVYLDFDWNSPKSHYCSYCKKYWSTDRQNWAWITELHYRNQTYMVACSYLYMATGDKAYADYLKAMLLDYADMYPKYKIHDKGRNTVNPAEHAGRIFGQYLDESVWFSEVCRAYSTVKPLLKKKEVDKVEVQLFRLAVDMFLSRNGGGNWQVWCNSGLAALGVVLGDKQIVKTALERPGYGYRHMMRTQVNKDGWWDENSANYHFYPLFAMLLTADAVRAENINLYDSQLEKMFTGPINSLYKDLTFPSHNDGWYGVSLPTQIKLYEIAYARYRNPLLLKALQACYELEPRLAAEALLTNTDATQKEDIALTGSYLFGHTGYGILRDGDKSVVLKYGPSGGGHGHPDKLSIAIHNGKSEILPDFGTCAYGIPDYLNWYKRTLSHNTVTVDFKDQTPTTGQLVSFDEHSIEAFTDKAYPGVVMERSLFFQNGKLVDRFVCTSDEEHNYDYVLLLTEEPRIDATFSNAVLDESVAYQQIKNVKKTLMSGDFRISTAGANIDLKVSDSVQYEVFTGTASGVPPSNPSIKTVSGSEKRPVQPCYPVIIRVKDKNMSILAIWEL